MFWSPDYPKQPVSAELVWGNERSCFNSAAEESKLVSRQVKPLKTKCKHSLLALKRERWLPHNYETTEEKEAPLPRWQKERLQGGSSTNDDGKRENTAVCPRGHTKLQQLAEICGTWLTHWQCSSKWKMKREYLIYWMPAAELNFFFSRHWDINTQSGIQQVFNSEKQNYVAHLSSSRTIHSMWKSESEQRL